MLRLEKSASK